VYLGMTASQVCALQDCRILHFMIHDRISFGGVLVAIGTVYLWLTMSPLRRHERWAWSALAASGFVGFLSFLAYLGYGYFDTWHGVATLALILMFLGGLVRTRGLRRERAEGIPVQLRSALGAGRALLILSSVGIGIAGLTIMTVGMTTVFVPQDLEFMGMTREAIRAINPHLVPLIAHDRAGFGGALASFAVAVFGSVRYGGASKALWQILAIAGIVGFGTAIGVHPAIGYLSATHLGPAVVGCVIFATGLALALHGSRRISSSPADAMPSR
jgi:MFS family permease